MLYLLALKLNAIHVIQAVLISTMFVLLLIVKERKNERKRA